jgi:molecular chaperone GrpE
VPDLSPNYLISLELRELLVQKLGILQKDNVVLQQSLREQQTQTTAQTEDLFLELLEVADALEALLDYLEKEYPEKLKKRYNLSHLESDIASITNSITKQLHFLQKGAELDLTRCYRKIIDDFSSNKFVSVSLERPSLERPEQNLAL